MAASLLLTACDGTGGASRMDEPTYGGSDSSSFLSGSSSSGGISFDDIMNLSNSGDTDALVTLFRGNAGVSGAGAGEGGPFAMDTLAMDAGDLGVPAGGTVVLSISGGANDYEEELAVSDDGMLYFLVPRQAVGSRITVSIAVKRADGSIVRSGSKTMLVTDGCQFSVTLINGSSVVLPATLKSASSINDILLSLGAGSSGTAKSFSPSLTPPPEGTTTYELSASGSEVQVLAWRDGDAIRYYADGMDACGIIPLPAYSGAMFRYCGSLTSIDMSGFDASGVTNMGSMFDSCSNLTSVNLSGWNTSNVTTMYSMFQSCYKLTSLDLSGWDTSNVTSMGYMFKNCNKLTSLDLSGWDTSNVTSMELMFHYCRNLTSLDLSSFDTSSVTAPGEMSGMFEGCTTLTTIYASSSFVVADDSICKVPGTGRRDDMFAGCTALRGGAGTACNGRDHVAEAAYARIDGGPSAPGYFTAR